MVRKSVKLEKRQLALGGILLLAALVRLAALRSVPVGMNQDEAFAGYQAWSLLHYGMDHLGYHNPVYFTAWGSGMNALYSYLTIPFVAVLGATKVAIRLPQAIFGVAGVGVAYGLGREIKGEKFGLLFAGLLAVNPWHIMASRWGLESNLVVFFLAAGLLCFLKGLEKPRWLIAAAGCYGLGLYCYATVWVVLPLALAMEVGWALWNRKLAWKDLVWPGVVLGLLGLPLVLFVMVNLGWLPEIRTPILSIPKMLQMRGGEYSLKNAAENFYAFFHLVITQSDGWRYNSLPEFGLYYKFSLPIILYGLVCLAGDGFGKKGDCPKGVFVLFWLAALAPTAVMLTNVNVNKVNSLHLPLIFCCAYGVEKLSGLLPRARAALAAAYILSFLAFTACYFHVAPPEFYPDVEGAVTLAQEVSRDGRRVYVAGVDYPNVLFALEYPTDRLVREADYANWPSAFLRLRSAGQWRFDADPGQLDPQGVYLCRGSEERLVSALEEAGFVGAAAGEYRVFWR